MNTTTLDDLRQRLAACWDAETSASPEEWSEVNPSRGQCAITAMIVQDIFGGDLLRTTVNGESHYYNRLPGGEVIDLTFDQFPDGSAYDAEPIVRDRDYVGSSESTMRRYTLLTQRLGLVPAS